MDTAKSRYRVTLLLGALVVLLAGSWPASAGWVEDRDGKTIIHVVVSQDAFPPDATRTDPNSRADIVSAKEFVRRFPSIFAERYRAKYKADPVKYGNHNWDNVEVELHKFSGIQVGGGDVPVVEVDLLAIAGKVAPDILYVNFRKSDNYIQQEFLYPLDKPEDGYLTGMTEEELDFRINRNIWQVIRRVGPKGNKQVWAVPFGGALGKVLLYRKDLFDAAGVAYPDNNWTWADMLEAAKKISNPNEGIYGLLLTRYKHEAWHWVTYLWSAGAEAMVYDEQTDQWRCTFDTREAAVALDYYTLISTEPWHDSEGKLRRGYSSKETPGAYEKWEQGRIGMQMSYIDEKLFATINPDIVGMAPVPLGPTGMRGAELNSRMMGIFAGVLDPVVRDSAWEYMKWVDCEDSVGIKTKILVEGGLGRFVNPKYLNMFGYPEVSRLSPKGWKEIFDIAIESSRPEPYGRNSNVAYDLMTYPITDAEQLALQGKLPPYNLSEGQSIFDLYRDYIKNGVKSERLDYLRNMLVRANARANEEMIGIIPPKERMWRRITAVAVLMGMVLAFGLMFRKVGRAFARPVAEGQKRGWQFRRYKWAYVILLPAVLSIFLWSYVPLGRGSVMAFLDYRLMGGSTLVWVDNFGDILWSPEWWLAVWNSLRYSMLVIGLTFLPPVALAILLQEAPRGKILFRTIYYLPAVLTGLVTILLWKTFYEQSEHGALNLILLNTPAIVYFLVGLLLLGIAVAFARRLFQHRIIAASVVFLLAGVILFYTCASLAKPILFPGNAKPLWRMLLTLDFANTSDVSVWRRLIGFLPEPYRWLSDPNTAMLCCVLPMVWAGMGPGCLIYLAALKGIGDEYYEAADMDGATFIDKILFVVFPILKALLIINFVGVFIASWNAEANILAMTAGAANTEVTGLTIFYKAFIYMKFGPATAMAWVLGFMLIGFTVNQLRILSRLEFRTTGETK